MSKCPYGHTANKEKLLIPNEEIIDTSTNTTTTTFHASQDDAEILKVNQSCPFKSKSEFIQQTQAQDEDDDLDEDGYIKGGGCPMKIPKELNTDFEFAHEIPFYHKNDFYFNIRGTCSDKDFLEKSSKIKNMPRHLKHSLFLLKDEVMQKIRGKNDFTQTYFAFEELRNKANKIFSKGNYRQAIAYFSYAYACFKWLEFKDPERNKVSLLVSDSLDPIFDDEIIEKRVGTDEGVAFEEATYKGTLTIITKSLAFCHIHLRNFTEALRCLEESLTYSDNKVPELYFRRSQVRMYNKDSTLDDLNLALEDIYKAIEINKEEVRFDEHLKILKIYMKEKESSEKENILRLFSNVRFAYNKIKEKNYNIDDYVYTYYESVETNWEILEDMRRKYKYAVKYHTETANDKQVLIAYKEYEAFMDVYARFKWYYSFDYNKMLNLVKAQVSESEK
jgi:tetratricopeptide (TPR) repeat protein